MDIHKNLAELGFKMPEVASPAANYVPYIQNDKTLMISGQIPFLNGEKMHIGRLGDNYSNEQGIEAAQACALNILAQVDRAVDGDWDKIAQCLKLGGFVNSTPDFNDQPAIINGASNLVVGAMGDKGKHTRFAVSAASLPFGVAVEIEAVFALV